MTDIVQLKNEKRRTIKQNLYNYDMNEDRLIEDAEFEEGPVYYEDEENINSKENKVKNRLFSGKYGKLYRSFNLQVLKSKMWGVLLQVLSI